MEKIIKLYDFIGREGRSRVNVDKLNLRELPNDASVRLDLADVDFLSRSFTDEILSQLRGKKYRLQNANIVISNMFRAVETARRNPRNFSGNRGSSLMLHFENMADMSRYLNANRR